MYLSLLEQSPRSRTIYTQLCFCFATTKGISQDAVIKTLNNGLKRMTSSFPWLAGQVVCVESENEASHIFRVDPFREVPQLVVRDHTTDEAVPNMKSMMDAHFPYSMLDERLFCSRSTFSEWEKENTCFPVLSFQANFVNGGFILTVQACHSVLDIVGEAQIIRLLSIACHNEPFTAQVTEGMQLDRRNIVPLLETHKQREASDNATKQETSGATTGSTETRSLPPQDLVWVYFSFTRERLEELKKAAQIASDDSTFVSTDDCISALIWQSLARSRLERISPSEILTFVRQVDVRRYMGVPDTYPGNMVSNTRSILTLHELSITDLGTLAKLLRHELDPDSLGYKVRTQATEQATGVKAAAGSKDRANTVTMSSWSKVNLSNVDFNLGFGRPVAVRRPRFTPTEGIVYLLPKAADGEIVAALCMRSEDMDRLRCDPEFLRYGQYIG